MVEDFAIECDPDSLVFSAHRLVPFCEIHNREPGIGQSDSPVPEDPMIVGTTMDKKGQHVGQIF